MKKSVFPEVEISGISFLMVKLIKDLNVYFIALPQYLVMIQVKQLAPVTLLSLNTLFILGSDPARASGQPLTQSEIQAVRKQHLAEKDRLLQSRAYTDRRSSSERQEAKKFETDWKTSNPSIAAFIGSWTAIEETIYVYPTKTQDKVCIVSSFIPSDINNSESGFNFSIGSVVNGRVQAGKTMFIREGQFLLAAGKNGETVNQYAYGNRNSLKNIRNRQFPWKIRAKLIQNKCTTNTKTLAESHPADELVDGLHRFCLPNEDTCFNFRKTGSRVVGSFVTGPLSMCIDGKLKGNTITGFGVLRERQTSRRSVNPGDEFQGSKLQEFTFGDPSLKIARSTTISIPLGSKEPISYGVWRKYNSLMLNLNNYAPETSTSHTPDSCEIK